MRRFAGALSLSIAALAGDAVLPLPDAPVRVVIPDVKAFDAALTGAYRRFAIGKPRTGDPLVSSWRKTQVGSKLEDQWARFAKLDPRAYESLGQQRPRRVGGGLFKGVDFEWYGGQPPAAVSALRGAA